MRQANERSTSPAPSGAEPPVEPSLAPGAERPSADVVATTTGAVPAAATVGAFFDVDNTIIRGASSFHLGVGLYRRGFLTKRDIVRFAFHQARYLAFGESRRQIDDVRARALSIIAGHSVAELKAIAEDVYDEVLSLRIFPGTQRLLDDHIVAGHTVWLITATPLEIGEVIARRLGATGALGTVAEHADGYYTGRLIGDMLHGQAKATAVLDLAARDGIDLAESYAYGDSMNDVPILSSVGHPCAINPDPRLRRHAAEVGWPVREFRNRRRNARRGTTVATVAGGAWFVGLLVRALRRSLRER